MFRKGFDSPNHHEYATAPDPFPAVPHPDLQGVKILVADDERDARQMITMALESCGAAVTGAYSADEAASQCFRHKFDVILTDLAMPGGDGISLIKRLRIRGDRTPVIALSGMRGDNVEQAVREAGFFQHLDKPIEVSFLTSAVADAVWTTREAKSRKQG